VGWFKDKDAEYQCKKDIKKTENRAEELTKEGRSILGSTEKDVKKAEKLQKEAAEKAAKANEATNHALNKQIEGQDKLATAGMSPLVPVFSPLTQHCQLQERR